MLEGDVESFAHALAGYEGAVQVPMLGPFSLAAATWLRVGERVITDEIARADLRSSLALGVTRLMETLQEARALPTFLTPGAGGDSDGVSGASAGASGDSAGAQTERSRPRILLHEPWLTQILHGSVPSFSGRRTLPALSAEVVTTGLRELIAAWDGYDVVLQVQSDAAAFGVAGSAGPAALRLDPTGIGPRGWERLAELLEAGCGLEWASVPLSGAGRVRVDPRVVAESIVRPLRHVGLRPPSVDLALVPGLSSESPVAARASLAGLAKVAVAAGELLAT